MADSLMLWRIKDMIDGRHVEKEARWNPVNGPTVSASAHSKYAVFMASAMRTMRLSLTHEASLITN